MITQDYSIQPQSQELVIEGKSVEEALKRGTMRLGVPQDQVSIDVLSDDETSPFGSDNGQAKVRIEANAVDLLEVTREVLSGILNRMGLEQFEITARIVGDFFRANIDSDEQLRFVIGQQGETLNSIQHLLQQILQKHSQRDVQVVVDAGNYRERRREDLRRLAHEISDVALEDDREVELDPMIPVERKIIHQTVKEIEGVKSHSIGEDTDRRVVILPKGHS